MHEVHPSGVAGVGGVRSSGTCEQLSAMRAVCQSIRRGGSDHAGVDELGDLLVGATDGAQHLDGVLAELGRDPTPTLTRHGPATDPPRTRRNDAAQPSGAASFQNTFVVGFVSEAATEMAQIEVCERDS